MSHKRLILLPLALLLSGCLADDVTTPEFEPRVLSLLGGLEVGDVMQFEGAEAEQVFLAGGGAGATYMIVPFFAAPNGTQRLNVEIGGGSAADAASPTPHVGNAAFEQRLGLDRFHLSLREWESRELGPRFAAAARSDQARMDVSTLRSLSAAEVPQVGDLIDFRTLDPNASVDFCQEFLERTGRVVAVTEHTILIDDLANPPGQLGDEALSRIANEFDELSYPTNVEYFGEPTDLDANGRVIVVFTSVVNNLRAGGFFFAGDLFPRSRDSALDGPGEFVCPASNEAEIFYILTPDPFGHTNFTVSARFVAQIATSVLGHEMQHLINASRRLYVNNAVDFEEVWLNEGLSHIAEELIFYAATPFQPGQNISLADVQGSQATIQALNEFQAQNLGRYASYLRNPQAESLLGIDNLPTRGASWAFLRYAVDHEPADERSIFFALVNSRLSGIDNLDGVLTRGDAIDLMQDWTLSAFTDDLQLPGLPERFQQPSWDFRSLLPAFSQNDAFPLDVLPLSAGEVTVRLRGGGAAFIRAETQGGAQQQISISSGGASPPPELRLSVVRTQ